MNTISKNLKKANDCFLRGEYEKSIHILTTLKKENPQLSHQFDSGIARATKKISPDDEVFEINFTDVNALKISQNCIRTDKGLVAKQSNSTPGLRVIKYPNYVKNLPYEICLEELAASSDLILFGLDLNDKLLFKKNISKNQTPNKIIIQLEPADLHGLFIAFEKPNVGDVLNFKKLKFSIRKPNRYKLKNYSIAGMASIPGRNEVLQKCVNSIVHQVDELRIFLNGYETIPPWLNSIENVKIFRSQDFDDLGDAGKFFTYDSSDCDYYFSVDDDILYPENYASTLIQQAEKFGCPVGVHGSLFTFPYRGYYQKGGRYVHHFKDSNKAAIRVHVLGTGTLCIPKKIIPKIPAFLYQNMADIWFAEFCVHNQIPLICVPREFGWLSPLDDNIDSIYDTNAGLKTIQKQILEKKCEDLAVKSLSIKTILPKIFIGIKTFNRFEYLKDCLDSLIKTIDGEKYDLVIAVADDGSTDGTVEYLSNVKLPYEFHVIKNNRKYAPGQLNTLIDTAQKTNFDFLVVVDDDVIFKKQGWLDIYYESAIKSGYHHLCHFNLPHFAQLAERRNEKISPDAMSHSDHGLVAYKDVYSCMGALFTLTPDVVKKVGWADEINFFVRGGWHVDYSARCCRAGFNEISRFFDVANSNEYIELQNTIASEYKTAIAWESDDFKRASTKEERLRRSLLIRDNLRIHVSKQDALNGEFIKAVKINKIAVNDVFDDVLVINLDRRKDRLSNMDRFLGHLSIKYNRYAAVNGQDSVVINQYKKYADKNFDFHTEKLLSSKEFFLGDLPDVIRAEHIKAQVRGPAIRSVGAWAYLSTYEEILRKCWDSGKSHFLVFDDDCLFHKDFHNLFNDAVMQLPTDWKLLQLGTMQYDWNLIRNYSKNLYLPDGVLVASHAVGFHRDLIPLFLRYISYRTMPFDMGPLHYAARLYKEKSFVTIPNLVIQDNSESDIQSSNVANNASNLSQDNVYRWNYNDYYKIDDL